MYYYTGLFSFILTTRSWEPTTYSICFIGLTGHFLAVAVDHCRMLQSAFSKNIKIEQKYGLLLFVMVSLLSGITPIVLFFIRLKFY